MSTYYLCAGKCILRVGQSKIQANTSWQCDTVTSDHIIRWSQSLGHTFSLYDMLMFISLGGYKCDWCIHMSTENTVVSWNLFSSSLISMLWQVHQGTILQSVRLYTHAMSFRFKGSPRITFKLWSGDKSLQIRISNSGIFHSLKKGLLFCCICIFWMQDDVWYYFSILAKMLILIFLFFNTDNFTNSWMVS